MDFDHEIFRGQGGSGSGSDRDRKKERERDRDKSRKGGNRKNGSLKLVAVIVAAALILGGAGVFALGAMLGWFGEENAELEVPSLRGKTFEQAAEELSALGLVIKEGEYVDSPDQEKGCITSHTPAAGTVVAEGTAVTVNISRGKKDGVVPNITNYDLAEAEKYLAEYSFVLGEQTIVESHLPKGTVISQNPKAGDKAKNGASIDVEVSDGKGKEMTTVPNLYGLSKEEADAALAAAGLTVDADNIKYEENELAPPNTILYQTISSDTEVETGSKIGYTLAKAPEVILPPDGNGGGEGEEGQGTAPDTELNGNTGSGSADGGEGNADGGGTAAEG